MCEIKYEDLIKMIKKYALEDFYIIKKIVESVEISPNDEEKSIDGSVAFDSYFVINSLSKEKQEKINDKKGVYVFKMIDKYSVPENFDENQHSAKRKDDSLKEFIKDNILYVGKSYDIKKRVSEHYSDNDKLPYSLKLGWTGRTELASKCIMFIFFLKDDLKDDAATILPLIEEQLHLQMKPLIGSPRI